MGDSHCMNTLMQTTAIRETVIERTNAQFEKDLCIRQLG